MARTQNEIGCCFQRIMLRNHCSQIAIALPAETRARHRAAQRPSGRVALIRLEIKVVLDCRRKAAAASCLRLRALTMRATGLGAASRANCGDAALPDNSRAWRFRRRPCSYFLASASLPAASIPSIHFGSTLVLSQSMTGCWVAALN